MLFDFKDQKEPDSFTGLPGSSNIYISSQDKYLGNALKNCDFSKDIHYTSNGRFSFTDLIIHQAKRLGSANIICSSFNISTIAARKLLRAQDCGLFLSMRIILNKNKRSNFKEACNMIEGSFDVRYTNIHAKVAVLWNPNRFLTIVTSGNLSSNNNIERGVISFSKENFDFDRNWLNII